jgi:hypothetical protein
MGDGGGGGAGADGVGRRLTEGQVRDLAPDGRAFAAARALARPGPWSGLGTADGLLWGRCQGSGATPYQVSVDLAGPTARCTCPSRKAPCKHGLALLLLWARGGPAALGAPGVDGTAVPAAAVRPARAVGPTSRTVADPAAQARRLATRLQLMGDGLAELDRWLIDLLAEGLASARRRPYDWWDGVAARLVDAQLPGLADRVRRAPGLLAGRDDWAAALLAELARWHLAIRAWQAGEGLDDADRAELRTYLGWARSAEEALAGIHVTGRWTVLGVHRSDLGRLTEQRTWLWHPDVGAGVLLDVATSAAALAAPQLVGATFDADVALYPGRAPLRLRLAGDPGPAAQATTLPDVTPTWAAALDRVHGLAALAVWQDRFPACVADLRVVDVGPGRGRGGPALADREDRALRAVDLQRWGLLALTGGHPTTLFGEVVLDGVRPPAFRPLAAATADGVVPLAPAGVAA